MNKTKNVLPKHYLVDEILKKHIKIQNNLNSQKQISKQNKSTNDHRQKLTDVYSFLGLTRGVASCGSF